MTNSLATSLTSDLAPFTPQELRDTLAGSRNPEETLANLVRAIQQRLKTDVCTVYLLEQNRSHLVLGVDVWLNNPRKPLEASGTSGEKVVLNGVLNCSVLDGWWAEAYDGRNGFAIGQGETHSDTGRHDGQDAESFYEVLQREVIPLFYDRDKDGLPRGWIARVKRAIRGLGRRFSADRMVMDYVQKCYIPAAGGLSSDMSRL